MMIRNLITTVALAGFATSAAALDSTEQRLIDYGFMPKSIEASQIVNTVDVSHGSVGMDQAAALGFIPAATEVQYTGRFQKQSTAELTATEERLQELGFKSKQLNFRATPVDPQDGQIAGRLNR